MALYTYTGYDEYRDEDAAFAMDNFFDGYIGHNDAGDFVFDIDGLTDSLRASEL